MSIDISKLPKVKKRKGDIYGVKPKKAGRFFIQSGDVGLAEADWDGEQWSLARDGCPLRNKEVYEAWGPIPGSERPTVSRQRALERKREAARVAFICADLGLIDCPGGGEWTNRAWSVNAVLDAAKSGTEEADGLSDAELDELFP